MRLKEASSSSKCELQQQGYAFEMAVAGPPQVHQKLPIRKKQAHTQGRLLIHSVSPKKSPVRRKKQHTGEPLSLGGLACLARAMVNQQGQKLHLASFGNNARKALLGSATNVKQKVAGVVRGKVGGRLVAAAWAGAVSKTATAPLETIRMQMMSGTKGSFREVVQSTWASGGALAFFSGNEADVLRTMPSKAIELASFDMYKKFLGNGTQSPTLSGIATSVAGGLAGITSTVAMFPLETARTRLAVNTRQYKNLIDCLTSIAKTEGFGALYKGLDASLIGVIPYAAVRLGMYDGLKWSHQKFTGSPNIPAQNSMLYGALAAVTSATVSFPLEVVRRRMMLGTASGSTLKAISHIAQTEGISSLYKGVGLTWLKQAPQYAVTFCCYDLAKAWLANEGKPAPIKVEGVSDTAPQAS